MAERPVQSTTSVETLVAKTTVAAPTLYRIVSGFGSIASTAVLAIIGMAWSEVRSEWRELKDSVAEIRQELDKQPSPEEFEKLRDKVEQINDRLIRIESRFDE